jgi:hypothetical protein
LPGLLENFQAMRILKLRLWQPENYGLTHEGMAKIALGFAK